MVWFFLQVIILFAGKHYNYYKLESKEMRSSLSKCSMQYYVLGVLSIAIICFIYNFGFIFDNDLENHAKKVGVEQFRKIAYNNDDDLIEQKFAIHHHNNYVQFIGLGEVRKRNIKGTFTFYVSKYNSYTRRESKNNLCIFV